MEYEQKGGLIVPVKKAEPRTVAQLVTAGDTLFARASDGSVWALVAAGRWDRIADLPNG